MKKLLPTFEALSDPVRLEMIHFVLQKKEITCPDIHERFSLSQPTISHHCKILTQSGVMKCRKEGTRNFYSVDTKLLKECGIDPKKIAGLEL